MLVPGFQSGGVVGHRLEQHPLPAELLVQRRVLILEQFQTDRHVIHRGSLPVAG